MLSLTAVTDLPEFHKGDDLARIIIEKTHSQLSPSEGAVLVVAQKVVSKVEGRIVPLADVVPSTKAKSLGEEVDKDPRLIELILSESRRIVRKAPGVLIVEHRCGHILANAGIDASNVQQNESDPRVLLWPEDPDRSAQDLSRMLEKSLGQPVPVVINDSLGRAWRMGTIGHAIGCAGLAPLWDQAGERDRNGNVLRVTLPATADALAAAAGIVQGEAAEGLPVVWVEGADWLPATGSRATELLRPPAQDLFR